MRKDPTLVFLQNEVKDIRNENKELKSRVSGLEDDNRVLQKTVANMKTQNAGYI